MSSVTTQTEVEAPSRIRRTSPQAQPVAEPSVPATRRGFEDRWPFIAMILSLCLFAAVFAKTVLQPAAETLAATSSDNWTEGP